MYRIALLLTVIGMSASLTPASDAAEEAGAQEVVGAIAGQVVDAEGGPVRDAHIVLCDQATGVPLAREARRPVTDEVLAGRLQRLDLLQRWTDPEGRFRFDEVPAGRYRLIAQSLPDARPSDAFDDVMAREIRLRGIVEDVVVSRASSPDVVIRPLGTGVLRIDDNLKDKDGVLVAISKSPTRADAGLGFVGWGGNFARQLIGGGRKRGGPLTVSGLPPGTIYVASAAFPFADDMSGFGAAEATVEPGKPVDLYVPIHSTWAGHHEPPDRLKPLCEKYRAYGPDKFLTEVLQRNRIEMTASVDGLQGMAQRDQQISRHLNREVELPTSGTAAFADVMAARNYVWMAEVRERDGRDR